MKTRRRLLQELALAGGASALVPSLGCARERGGASAGAQPGTPGAAPTGRARVVVVTSTALGQRGAAVAPDRGKLREMLAAGLRRLTGASDERAAVARFVRPTDTVGLKVNCLAGRQMSTHVELVEELVGLLQRAGLRRQQALVFDRSDADLRHAGYPIRAGGADYRCLGNDSLGFAEELTLMPSGASRLARAVTHTVGVLINLPVLKDHGIAGLSGALKNNFGLVHNPNKYHLGGCDPHVAEVNALPVVRAKQRLIVCDALRVQTDGGPAYHPAAAVDHGALVLGTDPVAVDVVLWELLERLRAGRKLPTLTADKRRPVHVAGAARRGLGVGDRQRIELLAVRVS